MSLSDSAGTLTATRVQLVKMSGAGSLSRLRTTRTAGTVGATHALDVVTRTLLRPGDTVLVDEPGWSVEYARLAALGMRVLRRLGADDGTQAAKRAHAALQTPFAGRRAIPGDDVAPDAVSSRADAVLTEVAG